MIRSRRGYRAFYFILLPFFLLLFARAAFAEEPTLNYAKQYLSPFYRQNMLANTNYTLTVSFNPDDGVSSVRNAMVSFEVYMSPTVNFYLWVDGQPCNNPSFQVHTTYMTSGRGAVSFDCSNRITRAGTYTVKLRADKATGASYGWLDVAYINDPKGEIDVWGTEYYENDDATVFLKLMDAEGEAITNASCYLDMYYPNIANDIHPPFIIDAGMQQLNQTGIYYYDFITPSISGLYIADAVCRYTVNNQFYYTLESSLTPKRTVTTGTYTGDPFVLNDYSEWLYTQCGSAGGATKACDAYYEWGLAGANVTQLFVKYLGESNGAPTMTFYYWNWGTSAWVALPNTLTFSATASGGVPSGIDQYQSNTVPLAAINESASKKVRIRTYVVAGSTFNLFDNWLTLEASEVAGVAQELKGSGEVHVSSLIPDVLSSRFYRIETCNGYTDGRCGVFQHEYDLPEGEIFDELNISAISTRTGATINYQTPFSVDCTAIYEVESYNGSEWLALEQGTDYDIYSQATEENCLISLYTDLQSGEEYNYRFVYDNYMKWEVLYVKQINDAVKPQVQMLCAGRGFNYTVPITDNTTLASDPVTDFCHRAYDDFYWLESYYNESVNVSVVGEYASYLQEMRFYKKEMYERFMYLSLNANTTFLPSAVWVYDVGNNSPAINSILDYLLNINTTSNAIRDYVLDNLTAKIDIIIALSDDINFTTHGVNDYLTTTVNPNVLYNTALLQDVLSNLSLTHATLLETKANVSLAKKNTDDILVVLQALNGSLYNLTGGIISEIDQNEAKLDALMVLTAWLSGAINATVLPSLASIQANITSVMYDVDSLMLDHDELFANLTSVRSDIAQLQLNVTGGFAGVNGQLATIISGIADLEAKLDCNFTINEVCDRLDNISAELSLAHADIIGVQYYLDYTLDPWLQSQAAAISAINWTVNGMDAYITNTLAPMVNGLYPLIQGGFVNQSTLILSAYQNVSYAIGGINQSVVFANFMLGYLNASQQSNYANTMALLGTHTTKLDTIISIVNQTLGLAQDIQDNVSSVITQLDALNQSCAALSSQLNQSIDDVFVSLAAMQDYSVLVNQSLHSQIGGIYPYLGYISWEVTNIEAKLDCNFTTNEVCDRLDALILTTDEINETTHDIYELLLDFSGGCYWLANYTNLTSCGIDDEYDAFLYYEEQNGCNTTIGVPPDNGTTVQLPCNYCSADMQLYSGNCTMNLQDYYWVDDNKAACCDVTGLPSDCLEGTSGYENYTGICSRDIHCEYGVNPFLKTSIPFVSSDRIDFICFTNFTTPYSCVAEVYKDGVLLQSNPEVRSIDMFGTVNTFTGTTPVIRGWYRKGTLLPDEIFSIRMRCSDEVTNATS